MCESFEKNKEKDTLKNKKSTVSNRVLFAQHKQLQKEVKLIHEEEAKGQVIDFLEVNKEEIKTELSKPKMLNYLMQYVKEMQIFDKEYSLWDESTDKVNEILAVYEKKEQGLKRKELKVEGKKKALNLEQYVIQEQESGKTNLQVIKEILEKSAQGVLEVPKSKTEEYQKILTLSNYSKGTKDNTRLCEIINLSTNPLLDEGSFENIILSIYEDEGISEQTKIAIQEEFKIRPIETGADLKEGLESRNELILQYENQLNLMHEKLYKIEEEEKTLNQKWNALNEELSLTSDIEKRAKLNKEIKQLEGRLYPLQNEQQQMRRNYTAFKDKKPTREVFLRGYKAKLTNKLIHIKSSINRDSIRIPIEVNEERIGEMANSLFLYQALEKIGAEKLIFPEEQFNDEHLPSTSMVRFSNEILAALNLGHSGEILTRQDLIELDKQLNRLQKPNNLHRVESPLEATKEEFKELGILDGNILVKHKYLELLERIQTNTNLNLFDKIR